MAYVYEHYTLDSNRVFYVGISLNDSDNFLRAKDKNKRSKFWKSIYAKHGFYHKIAISNVSWEEAKIKERELIKAHGRANNGTGILCNLTDGGEGCAGFVATDEYRRKISEALKGKQDLRGENNPFWGKKHSEQTREKISHSLKLSQKNKGQNNPNYGKKASEETRKRQSVARKGRLLTQEHKEKIKQSCKGIPKSNEWKSKRSGANNFFYKNGQLFSLSKNPNAKKCIDLVTGEIYGCLKEACLIIGLSYSTQRKHIAINKINRRLDYITI